MTTAGGEVNELPWVDAAKVKRLAKRIEAGEELQASDLDGSRYTAADASVLMDACAKGKVDTIYFGGHLDDSLTLEDRELSIAIESVSGDLSVHGTVDGYLHLMGRVGGDVSVSSRVEWNGSVLYKQGVVTGELLVHGTVHGNLSVRGIVEDDVLISGTVTGDLNVAGRVDGDLRLSGDIQGRSTLQGVADQPLNLATVGGARFGGEVVVGAFVTIENCDFRRCPDVARFNLIGSFASLFPSNRGLLNSEMSRSPDELANINRQLRTNLEGRNNRPASSLFYMGEMDARRRAAWNAKRIPEWFILSAYWLMSGYGLKAWRPITWFVLVAALGTAYYTGVGMDPDAGSELLFTVRSMVAFFNPPEAELTDAEQWVQLGLRFAGPILLAQAILAVRERVAR